MTGCDSEHVEQCFACWLDAVGVDQHLAAALITAGYAHGWEAAARRLLPRPLVPHILAQGLPDVNEAGHAAIAERVRTILSVPASPDVAAMAHRQGD